MLYFVRHGSTDWNDNINSKGEREPRCQGRANIQLNQKGICQAKETYEKLKDIKFDKVVCSPLDRTRTTCELVYKGNTKVEYDERIRDLDDYINKADVAARAYTLSVGCMFSLTEQGFTAKPAKGNIIELAAGNKLKPVASATSGSTTVGVVDAVEKVGRYTYYVVRVTG